MAKIVRYSGNLAPFGSNSTGTERTVFGDTAQSDTLDSNINADYLTGWEIVTPSDAPTRQDFNAMGFTATQLLSYLHQMGVAEWQTDQEYFAGSAVTHGGSLFLSLTTNDGKEPADTSDGFTNWKDISGGKAMVQTTDATVTPILALTVPDTSAIMITANVVGSKADFSETIGATIQYTARRSGGGAVEVAAAVVSPQDDSGGAPAVTADVNANTARILVTGLAVTTYNWVISYDYTLQI